MLCHCLFILDEYEIFKVPSATELKNKESCKGHLVGRKILKCGYRSNILIRPQK